MRLNPNYVIRPVGDEWVPVPTGNTASKFHGIARLNATAPSID